MGNGPRISVANQTTKPLNEDHCDKVQPSKTQLSETSVQHFILDRFGAPIHNACQKKVVRECKREDGCFGQTGRSRKGTSNRTSCATSDAMVTTMMLKNIPCHRSQEEILRCINQQGYGGKYDFFYLPENLRLGSNLGYAFINIISADDAARFKIEMTGFKFPGTSAKRCAVVPAHVQGLYNNLTAFKRTQRLQHSSMSF